MSGDNVTYLHVMTDQPIAVARVLDAAQGCSAVLVLGRMEDDTLYAAASTGDAYQLLWWLETFKHRLLAGEFA
jgi:hypothetical protein